MNDIYINPTGHHVPGLTTGARPNNRDYLKLFKVIEYEVDIDMVDGGTGLPGYVTLTDKHDIKNDIPYIVCQVTSNVTDDFAANIVLPNGYIDGENYVINITNLSNLTNYQFNLRVLLFAISAKGRSTSTTLNTLIKV